MEKRYVIIKFDTQGHMDLAAKLGMSNVEAVKWTTDRFIETAHAFMMMSPENFVMLDERYEHHVTVSGEELRAYTIEETDGVAFRCPNCGQLACPPTIAPGGPGLHQGDVTKDV
jgi:hypothetical protein